MSKGERTREREGERTREREIGMFSWLLRRNFLHPNIWFLYFRVN